MKSLTSQMTGMLSSIQQIHCFKWWGGQVCFQSLFIYYKVTNPHRKPVRDLLPMGFAQPLTHSCQNMHPYVQVWFCTGTGAGWLRKPQGFLCHSLVRAGSKDLPDSVMLMYNPRSVVNDQGADPLSAPQLLILSYMVCALYVCMYVMMDNQPINANH